jgi:hypothetical protein
MATTEAFEMATRRARRKLAQVPRAVAASYDRRNRRIVIRLSSNLEVTFSPADAQGLESATPAQLHAIEITPSGLGLHFPKLDADLYLPALLEGFMGSRKWMARRLGASGGKSKSPAKVAASRRNGRLGGRPARLAAR